MTFPDVNGAVIAYLGGLLAVPVVSRVPDPRPAEFVQVRRVGGQAAVPVRDIPRTDIKTWAPDDTAAMALGREVRGHMWALAGTTLLGFPCYRVAEFLALRLDDDPATNSPIAWATYSLTTRANSAVIPAP